MSMLSNNQSSITFEDLYNQTLINIYGIYWDITLVITTIVFVLMLYVIIFKSAKEMGSYKWYLCHQLIWSYAYDIHMSLWKPIPLWPYYVGFSTGIFRHLSRTASYVPLIIMAFISVGLGFSVYISALHRYVHASPMSKFFKLYNIFWLRFLHYALAFIIMESVVCIPIVIFIPDFYELKNSLILQNPALERIFELEPSLFGYDREPNGEKSNIFYFMAGIVISFIITLVSIILLYLNFVRIVAKNKNILTSKTLKFQTILFRALCLQMFIGVVLLILPMTAAYTMSLFILKWVPKFSLFMIMITALHTLMDFSAIIYSVKAYRLWFYSYFQKCMKKIGISFKEPSNIVIHYLSRSVSPPVLSK